MKKILYILAAGLMLTSTSNSLADVALDNTAPGADVSFNPGVAGAQNPFVFSPSTNVNITGHSDNTSFAIAGYHEQATQKKSGQAYGMASDSNKMFFQDISTTAISDVTGTNSTDAFSGWYTM